MNNREQISILLKENIDELYTVFSEYPCPIEGIVTCMDYGPTQEEALALAKPLKEIPQEYITRLEFYDHDQKVWGTIAEVKYLTPRILECLVEAINSRKDGFTLRLPFIHFKLSDLNKGSRFLKNGSKWTKKEALCINRFLLLFHEYMSTLPDNEAIEAFLEYIEVLCDVVEDITPYIDIWQKVPDHIKSKQIEAWLNGHFSSNTFLTQNGLYQVLNENNLKKIKEWVLSNENITKYMELFSQDPWWKIVLLS